MRPAKAAGALLKQWHAETNPGVKEAIEGALAKLAAPEGGGEGEGPAAAAGLSADELEALAVAMENAADSLSVAAAVTRPAARRLRLRAAALRSKEDAERKRLREGMEEK
jgi:hypothetical protein